MDWRPRVCGAADFFRGWECGGGVEAGGGGAQAWKPAFRADAA